jgi:Mn2+/Fe2+ NRAMP family transporter
MHAGILAIKQLGIAGAMDIFGISPFIAIPVAAVVVWFLVVRGSYKYVERVLLVLCLIYASYIASGFLVHPDWAQVFHATVVPPFQLNQGYLLILVASVLPPSTAYSIAEAFGWERGVGHTFKEAPQFLSLYTGIIALGAGITLFVPADRLVFVLNLPNVVGGMLLPLVLVLMILLCNDRRLMGRYVNGRIHNGVAWTTTVLMTVLTLLIILTTLFPGLFGGA